MIGDGRVIGGGREMLMVNILGEEGQRLRGGDGEEVVVEGLEPIAVFVELLQSVDPLAMS